LITVRFKGGLGNQLFEYATARALAERHGTEIMGDVTDYGVRFPLGFRRPKRDDRTFDLARFAPPHLHYPGQWQRLVTYQRSKLSWPRWLHVRGMTHRERHAARFDPAVLDLPNGSAINGYFQSERYFKTVANTLRRELWPGDIALRARVEAKINAMRRPGHPLASLHVRRGDYVDHSAGPLTIGIEQIRAGMARLPGCDFAVFSDDVAWCRAMLTADNVFFTDFTDPLEDFHAMGVCDHHILANSTFSWWAVWLRWTPGKRVLAPTDWHRRYPDRWQGDEDIYAEGWERY
jgi:hypothetical protein